MVHFRSLLKIYKLQWDAFSRTYNIAYYTLILLSNRIRQVVVAFSFPSEDIHKFVIRLLNLR